MSDNKDNAPLQFSKNGSFSEIASGHSSHFLPDCLFCKISQQESAKVLERFDHCFVIHDAFPVSPGHALIIPYKHTEHWFTSELEVQFSIINALNHMKMRLDNQFQPEGYNIGMNCGVIAGQTIPHLHVHLIPRYRGDMEDPRGGIRGVIPHMQKY
jgi:diadenosine tetraphosphate (Ap4A) HIT family hydrolase